MKAKPGRNTGAPSKKIGPAHHATNDAAVHLSLNGRKLLVGVAVFAHHPQARIEILSKGKRIFSDKIDLSPASPYKEIHPLMKPSKITDLSLRVSGAQGKLLINYQPKPRVKAPVPPPATEPPAPEQIASSDELYLTGLHLEQYRHATRMPELYWREALKRDAGDSRAHTAMARWRLRRGEWFDAEEHARAAIARLTFRNSNPADSEAHYTLGLILSCQGKHDEAYAAFYKATWNQAWTAAGYAALAEIDCRHEEWATALFHLNESLKGDTDNLRVRDLKVMVLRQLGAFDESGKLLRETLALDPLDWWARWLNGEALVCDAQVRLDIAHDLARAGFFSEAISILEEKSTDAGALLNQNWGAAPLIAYTLGWMHELQGDHAAAREHFARGAKLGPNYCFPSRLEEILIFESAMKANPRDPRAPYYLGNLLYDRRRHKEAIGLWEKSARLDAGFSTVWRNLGIGCLNIHGKPAKARAAYERALKAAPQDARLVYERDQLWKRLGESPARRLRELERHLDLVAQRDDLAVELSSLYNQTGQPGKALAILTKRNFQPWEGGEGQALGQYVRACVLSARTALDGGAPEQAIQALRAALQPPRNLGEARHILANQSDVRYWLGCALAAGGDKKSAQKEWTLAATFKGDFQDMSVRAFSEMTYYSALAWEKLGKKSQARKLLRDLLGYARMLEKSQAKIDYFATSLPTMLLFDDDIQFRQVTAARFLQAQAALGLGQKAKGRALLKDVLRRDPNHALAADLHHAIFRCPRDGGDPDHRRQPAADCASLQIASLGRAPRRR
ncbi:tetratricopeptide repeat protein [Kamptonema cortianum]|nr:tetratricopeptide repeat protein [Kamptonema cortianum]